MLRRGQTGDAAPSQRLLLPETLELSPKDAAFLRENLPALTRLGVGLSGFGERTFLLDALPPFVKSTSPPFRPRTGGRVEGCRRLDQRVARRRSRGRQDGLRHSVKANDPLFAGPELEGLIESLRQCDMPYTCPHGRPTLIEMNYRELERKFGRVTG